MRVGKLEAKQEVMYVGNLKVARIKYGQFVRGKRVDLDILIAREVLKIPGFIIPYFLAKYTGPDSVRKIRVRDEIINCQRGLWVKLPITIKYKIRGDSHFQVGPEGKDKVAPAILGRQAAEEEKKRRVSVSRPKPAPQKKVVTSPVVITETTAVETKKEKPSVKPEHSIGYLNLDKKVEKLLQESGIHYVNQIKSAKKLLEIKGIGPATARKIMTKIKGE